MLDSVRIILSRTSHPGNIGGAARAMKNMGLSQLVLVSPGQFPDPVATDRASGADDILTAAQVVPSLSEGLKDCQWVFGTSARQRAFPWPQLSPKAASVKIHEILQQRQSVAVVFGNEQSGLSNEDLQLCDYHISIATDPHYASLNLACAVQIIAYEIHEACTALLAASPSETLAPKATVKEVQGLLEHWIHTAELTGFLDSAHPKKFIPRMQKFLVKAQLSPEEIHLLRGFLKTICLKEPA